VPTAMRGPVVGPACRACASGSELVRVRTAGRGVGFFFERGEAVRAAEKYRPALCAMTLIYSEVGAAIFA
jgi:hypothetical protein